MNFDPNVQEGGPGVGTVTGSFSIDTSTTTIVALDLVEATNNGEANIGGAYGSPTYATFTFANTGAYNVYATATVGQKDYEFGGNPYLFVSVWTDSAVLDGVLIGPTLQFDFAYPQGGSVQPGNFELGHIGKQISLRTRSARVCPCDAGSVDLGHDGGRSCRSWRSWRGQASLQETIRCDRLSPPALIRLLVGSVGGQPPPRFPFASRNG